MIELPRKDYHKALPQLRQVNINTLFAEAVLEQHISGNVYVDCSDNPRSYYVIHPYGMSLLFGDAGMEPFTQELYHYITHSPSTRRQTEWLQVDPEGEWSSVIGNMVSSYNSQLENEKILINTRVNFSFNRDAYQNAKQTFPRHHHPVIRITKELYLTQSGVVIARSFWPDEHQFAERGVGYHLLSDGEIASTSFSAFRTANQLEIGIETSDAHRGNGYAVTVCAAIIDYCLEHDLEPVWSCRLENQASYHLAQKLGFEPAITLPFYRLNNSIL